MSCLELVVDREWFVQKLLQRRNRALSLNHKYWEVESMNDFAKPRSPRGLIAILIIQDELNFSEDSKLKLLHV